jgi:SRSO17 transposase
MTKQLPVGPAFCSQAEYAARFHDLFGARAQRHALRRYLEGLLLPAESNETLTALANALANTEPVVGAQRKGAQSLQWFLSEFGWNLELVNRRRPKLLVQCPRTAPNGASVLVIEEHGDRKWDKGPLMWAGSGRPILVRQTLP